MQKFQKRYEEAERQMQKLHEELSQKSREIVKLREEGMLECTCCSSLWMRSDDYFIAEPLRKAMEESMRRLHSATENGKNMVDK